MKWNVAAIQSYILEPPEQFRKRDRFRSTFFNLEKAKQTGVMVTTRAGQKLLPKAPSSTSPFTFEDNEEPSTPLCLGHQSPIKNSSVEVRVNWLSV